MADNVLKHDDTSDEARISYAMQCCVSRRPEQSELKTLQQLLTRQRQRLNANELNAAAILQDSKSNTDTHTDNERAAWTLLTRVLLNLDETITKE